MADPGRRRLIGPRICAVLFLAFGVNALVQAPHFLPGWGDDPLALSAQQLLTGLAGTTAGVAAWRGRAWAWIPALAYALLTPVMLLSLGPLLDLDESGRAGLPWGAALVLVLCGGCAWYLQRALRAIPAAGSPGP